MMVETVDEVVLSVSDLVPNPGKFIRKNPTKFDLKVKPFLPEMPWDGPS
jgi:hypothetical protein